MSRRILDSAAAKRAELIAKAKKKSPAVVVVPRAYKFQKLSKVAEYGNGNRFCKCLRCRMIYENDVNTMHAPCPKCGAVMENISLGAAQNLKEAWDKEAKVQ